MRLAAAQYASVPGDLGANVRRHVAFVERAAAQAADVVVFPELSLISYEPRFAAVTATAPEDPLLAPLQAASERFGMLVAVGLPLATADLPRIAMVVYRPFAPTVVHTKRRLHADEVPWFSPGDEPTVLTLGGRQLAPAICFEALQREHVDAVAALGATVYLASIAKHALGVDAAHETLAAVAREHRMTVVLANAVGYFADGEAGGRSAAWRPDGTLVASLEETGEGLVYVDIEDVATENVETGELETREEG